MADLSPSVAVKRLENEVRVALRKVDSRKLDRRERDTLAKMEQAFEEARIYARDYEMSEMLDEQIANAKGARKWLARARSGILKASEHDIFGAVDVAHLSAQIDQITGGLR